jgi:hypothetical protein
MFSPGGTLIDVVRISKGPSGSQLSPAKLSKVQQTEARQQKKQKRKAEEGKLHVKRQEMDKAKVRGDPTLFFSRFAIANEFSDNGRGQTVFLSFGSNRVV